MALELYALTHFPAHAHGIVATVTPYAFCILGLQQSKSAGKPHAHRQPFVSLNSQQTEDRTIPLPVMLPTLEVKSLQSILVAAQRSGALLFNRGARDPASRSDTSRCVRLPEVKLLS